MAANKKQPKGKMKLIVEHAGKWLLLAFGQSYSDNALKLLWVLCLSSLPMGVTSVYMSMLRVKGKLKQLMGIAGFTAIAVLVASYLVMPVSGLIGAMSGSEPRL